MVSPEVLLNPTFHWLTHILIHSSRTFSSSSMGSSLLPYLSCLHSSPIFLASLHSSSSSRLPALTPRSAFPSTVPQPPSIQCALDCPRLPDNFEIWENNSIGSFFSSWAKSSSLADWVPEDGYWEDQSIYSE